jgi:hypothetical protein
MKIPQAKATSEAVEARRKEWNDLVELHDAYNKHEVYDPDNHGELCVCKLCGVPLEKKHSWRSSGDHNEYRRMTPGMTRRNGDWNIGRLSDGIVRRVPKAYRHFLYEALLSRVGEDGTCDEEMAAILSCRDASVPSESLRKYAVATGGMFAYAFAKSQGDWADDLLVASRTNAKACCRFLADGHLKPSDLDRIAVSKEAALALEFAKNVDKGPHQVTRDGAAREPGTAMDYASEVDKNPHTITSRGTLLRTVVMRTSAGLQQWTGRFPGSIPPEDKTRQAACRTKYGAFQYAEKIDKGPHPMTEKVLIHSAFYGPRYMYEIACAPVQDIERCFSGGFDALKYMGVFHIKPSIDLWNQCNRNSTTRVIYRELAQLYKKPIDKAAAMKKSVLAAAYIIQNDLYSDKHLMTRAAKNRGYGWMMKDIAATRYAVAKRVAKKAAAKSVPVVQVHPAVLSAANPAAVYAAMIPPKPRKQVIKLVTFGGIIRIPRP